MGLKKNNPGCSCCEESSCLYCSGTPPATVLVTFSGIVDGTCGDCDSLFNATHVLANISACSWEVSGTFCSGVSYAITATALPVPLSGWGWYVKITINGVSNTFSKNISSSTPFDCSATRTGGFIYQIGTGTITECDVRTSIAITVN